jgi:hypothetical protein
VREESFALNPQHIRAAIDAAASAALVVVTLVLMPAATALVGTASDDEYAFTTRLAIGGDDGRACSGALIATSWVLTAASCYLEDPASGLPPSAGAPSMATVATIGRADLTTDSGQERDVVELVPHGLRDLVLARLFGPVPEIEPVTLAAGPLDDVFS